MGSKLHRRNQDFLKKILDKTAIMCYNISIVTTQQERKITMANTKKTETKKTTPIKMSLYDRTKAQVYATGNKWAIENFNATH